MPRPSSTVDANGLPLWDTYETFYFMGAGITVGLVIGLLFPSLWRAFRRRFRSTQRFHLAADSQSPPMKPPVLILPDSPQSREGGPQLQLTLMSAFVAARNQVHDGQLREAVQTYLQILGHEQVSKHQTNRVLYELAQVYQMLGLLTRASDTAFELLSRKPRHREAFELLLQMAHHHPISADKVRMWVSHYSGSQDDTLRMKTSHALCHSAQSLLSRQEWAKAKDLARWTLRQNPASARARLLLWKATSLEAWDEITEPSAQWVALGADLEARLSLSEEFGVSPAAEADHLARLLWQLSQHPSALVVFQTIQEEFYGLLQGHTPKRRTLLTSLLFHAALEVFSTAENRRQAPFHQTLSLVGLDFETIFPLRAGFGPASEAFLVGGRHHSCTSCFHPTMNFVWSCTECHAFERAQPVFQLESRTWPPDRAPSPVP